MRFLTSEYKMSKKKGVSAEEKRTRMLQLFYEKKEFFQLKELEKIAPKEKGIISQSVKDVVQNLVDDGLVDTDKIGTSVYFWAYPSKAKISRENRLSEITDKLSKIQKRIENVIANLESAKAGKEESDERKQLLHEISILKNKKEELLGEMKKYQDNNPEILEKMRIETSKSKEAVNRWTDNIFAVKSWCKNKFAVDEGLMNKQFGIPTELDYFE